MPRGLGTTQRLMLFQLADHEVCVAEECAEHQHPYRSPGCWSLTDLTISTFHEQLVEPQRAAHDAWQETLRRWQIGDAEARTEVARVTNINNRIGLPTVLDPSEFEPRRPNDYELRRFNPSRAIGGLERRGFVLRDEYHRTNNLALTVEGFVEARRLGGVRPSEIVDLDQVQANWCAPIDFRLGRSARHQPCCLECVGLSSPPRISARYAR
jgi:hypothetical protein